MELTEIVARLTANRDAISALGSGVSEAQAIWRPEPGQWSILEVVNHLADEEVEDFRSRLDYTLHRPGEEWRPIDPQGWVTERSYNERSLPKSLDRFTTRRAESIVWLVGLEAPDWSLAYEHPRIGPITAGDLITSWVAHDHIHIRQLNRLHRAYLVDEFSEHSADYAGGW